MEEKTQIWNIDVIKAVPDADSKTYAGIDIDDYEYESEFSSSIYSNYMIEEEVEPIDIKSLLMPKDNNFQLFSTILE